MRILLRTSQEILHCQLVISTELLTCIFLFDRVVIEMADTNYKGLLQIHCQKAKVELPHYSCTHRMQGNSPVFVANLTVLGRNFTSEAEFSSKKQAEKNAAKVALRELGLLDTGEPKVQDDHEQPLLATSDGTDGQAPSNPDPVAAAAVVAAESQEVTPSPEVCKTGSAQDPVISHAEDVGSFLPSTPVTSTPASAARNVPLSFKNILQERAQKMGLALPQYETTPEGSGFVCTVTFNGQHFKSEGISSNKKIAQQNAASLAIKQFNLEQGTDGSSPILKNDVPKEIQGSTATPEKFDATMSYKNLFQENCQQRGNKPPAYSTTWNGSGFISFVQFGDKTVSSRVPCTTKKQAEQLAAREALLAIGVTDPENAYRNKGSRKNKSKRMLAPKTGFKRTWVHSHGGQGPQLDRWGDVDYFWEQAVASKRLKMDPSESPANRSRQFEGTTFALPLEHRQDLTVAEIWKEKKNIVIVGNAESSFILYCTRVPGTCNIFNTRTMSLVLLEPGHRIIGLDACYTDHNGKVALQAERCANVIIPETPDPVLTSCGVVLLYQDPQSSSLQVLLKRYLSSQAFVNVAAALAQYFRRMVSGRCVWLDIESLTEHIHEWMLEEVQNIAAMHEEALHQLFSYMWKFNKKWCSVLNPPLPHELELLKARAEDELARRQASNNQHPEDFYHPWSLPKGNFKHRMLSTGLFIEPAVDCAVRELKEETGIKLDTDEVKNCPCIDLLQTDNFNPHKGDTVKYFLYMYHSNSEEELNMSQETDLGNSSIDCETEQNKDGGDSYPEFPTLDTSTEQETVEKMEDGKKGEESPHKCQNDIHEDCNSLSNEEERHSNTEPLQVEQCKSTGNEKALEEKRGVKRKRNDDDDDDDNDDCKVNSESLHETQENYLLQAMSSTPNTECDNSVDSLTTPKSGDKQDMITAKSPYVQGSVHEECAWFTIEEARIKSPVFEQIYHTEQFKKLLASIMAPEER
ncbi:uncharacterized protein LOC144659327 isoform X2 [Oculina patagonica]